MAAQEYSLKALDTNKKRLAETEHWEDTGFHFKAKTTKVSVVQKGKAPAEIFSDLQWKTLDISHGDEVGMTAKAVGVDGKDVRFVVQQQKDGAWAHYATVPGTVKDGVASGTVRVHHPVLPPTGPTPAPDDITKAETADLRFTVELGTAPEQPRAKKKELKHLGENPASQLSAAAWGKPELESGGESSVEVKADVPDGRIVTFTVTSADGKELDKAEGKVKGGKAVGKVVLVHPALSQQPPPADLTKVDAVKVKFKAELGAMSAESPEGTLLAPKPLKLHLLMKDEEGKLHASCAFEIKSGDKSVASGTTTDKGYVDAEIAPGIKDGELTITGKTSTDKCKLIFEKPQKLATVQGVQQALLMLGYYCDDNNQLDDVTRKAISDFQTNEGLPITGEPDGKLRARLKALIEGES